MEMGTELISCCTQHTVSTDSCTVLWQLMNVGLCVVHVLITS